MGNIGGTLKNTAQNIAENPGPNLPMHLLGVWVTMELKRWSLGMEGYMEVS